MSQLMLKTARQAVQDSALFASLIDGYSQRENLSWPQIAAELQIEESQLAKLALCRLPRRQLFLLDIANTAAYVDMNSTSLSKFVRKLHSNQHIEQETDEKRPFFSQRLTSIFSRQTLAFGFALLIILIFAAFVFAQPENSEATLVIASGNATIQQTDQVFGVFPRSTETLASTGEMIVVDKGDTISLSTGATAQLRLFDGSTVDLFEGSVIEVAELVTNEQVYRVQLDLLTGRTLNRVVKLLGVNDSYKIKTPASTASVRGTVFSVAVISDEATYVSVTEGLVEVQMADQQVMVAPGEEVTAVVGQTLTVQPQNEPEPDELPQDSTTDNSPSLPGERVTLCHIPPGNPENTRTIIVGASAVAAHLAHGDSLGTCITPTPTGTLEATSTSTKTITPSPTGTPDPGETPSPTSTLAPGVTPSPTSTFAPGTTPTRTTTPLPGSSATPVQTTQPDPTSLPNPSATAAGTTQPEPSNTPMPDATATAVPTTRPNPTSPPPTAPPPPTATPIPTSPPQPTEEAMVTLCHNPTGNAQTITVAESAVAAHLAHGDTLGPCP